MAMWDYDVEVNGADLAQFCDRVIVVTEAMGNKDDADIKIPGIEGVLHIPNKLWDSGNVILSTWLKYSAANGTITHPDGSAGHVYDNFSSLKGLLRAGAGQFDLSRVIPDVGEVHLFAESLEAPQMGDAHFHYLWVLKAAKPFWRATSTSAITAGSFVPGGDGVIDDMVITFGGDGSAVIDGETIAIVGSSGGGGIIVDCGARTIVQGGNYRDAWFRPSSERWLRLRGGISSSVALTNCTGVYYPKWQ